MSGILSFAEFQALPMVLVTAMDFSYGGHIARRNNEYGVQVETVTPLSKAGKWGTPQHYYYLDDDDREFETALACYNAYRWRHGKEAIEEGVPS